MPPLILFTPNAASVTRCNIVKGVIDSFQPLNVTFHPHRFHRITPLLFESRATQVVGTLLH